MTSFRMRQSDNDCRYLRAVVKTRPSVDDPTEAFGMISTGRTVETKPAPEPVVCPVCGMPAYGGLTEFEGEAMCHSCLEGMVE